MSDERIVRVTRKVFCTVKIEGTHFWRACPFAEVNFLRETHRHIFIIRATTFVTHSDRDVEFIMLGRAIKEYLTDKYCNEMPYCTFEHRSCEMIANELISEFGLCECEVNEDGENGAIVSVEVL